MWSLCKTLWYSNQEKLTRLSVSTKWSRPDNPRWDCSSGLLCPPSEQQIILNPKTLQRYSRNTKHAHVCFYFLTHPSSSPPFSWRRWSISVVSINFSASLLFLTTINWFYLDTAEKHNQHFVSLQIIQNRMTLSFPVCKFGNMTIWENI